MCVCHIEGEWCFYCEMHSPLEDEVRRLRDENYTLTLSLGYASEWETECHRQTSIIRGLYDQLSRETRVLEELEADVERLRKQVQRRATHAKKRAEQIAEQHGDSPNQTHNYFGGQTLGYWQGRYSALADVLDEVDAEGADAIDTQENNGR